MRSSLKEALERPADRRVGGRGRSGSTVRLLLRASRGIERPVDLARCLVDGGASLRLAHGVLNQLAATGTAAIELRGGEPADAVISALHGLGIDAAEIRSPDVDVRSVRRRLGLSQAEFATRFGFERDTVQNWEQRRNMPDAAARTLLSLIERNPALVDEVLTDRGA